MGLNISELSPEVLEKLGLTGEMPKQPTKRSSGNGKITMEEVRQHSLRVLAVLDKLSQQQRDRVLAHAIKVNRV
jgi:hypothetical protein